MITYEKGDITQVQYGVIAHGCNAQGVMGSGVALAIRNKFPKAYHSYIHHCAYEPKLLGSVDLCKISDDLYVANCITQERYGKRGKFVSYPAVSECFQSLRVKLMKINKDFIINIPKIGAGLGGGDWDVILPTIQIAIPNHNIVVWNL